ncbi:MAG: hypothetical protein Q8R57_03480 [Bacteroidota bacterium]|nr:hypothetical protein [Bacteroidota bacterium]
MKKSIYLKSITLIVVILFSHCKVDKDEEFVIQGKLLNSCENPSPEPNKNLILTYEYGTNKKGDEIYCVTDNEGKFLFKYSSKFNLRNLTIGSSQANGLGFRTYLFDIALNKSLEVGVIYSENNFKAKLRVNLKKASSINDTVFYEKLQSKFTKFVVGPFLEGQVIDSLNRNVALKYESNNKHQINFNYTFKVGNNSIDQTILGRGFNSCSNENYLNIDL